MRIPLALKPLAHQIKIRWRASVWPDKKPVALQWLARRKNSVPLQCGAWNKIKQGFYISWEHNDFCNRIMLSTDNSRIEKYDVR